MRAQGMKAKSIILVLLLIAGSLMALIPVSAESPVCVVKWAAERQVIEGFGASGAFGRAGNLMIFPEASRQKILDLLFSEKNGIGLNIVRNLVGDGAATPTIEPKEDQWNWTGDEAQIWLMNEAKKYGVTRFMSSVWSPPAWMKTNDSAINGGELKPDKYRAYAEYLSNYVRGYKEKHGIDIYAISLANEPNFTATYSSCRWTSLQFKDFVKTALIPVFKKDNVKAKVMMPESMNFDESLAYDTLKDSSTAVGVDIIGTHAYDFAVREFPLAKSKEKKIWMTEVGNNNSVDGTLEDGLKYAKLLHDHLTVTQVNAWLYWWFVAGKEDSGGALIGIGQDQSYQIHKRLYTIGNFSRFVRPGYVRIDAVANPASNVFVSAYKDKATGKFAIVAINKGDIDQIVNIKLSDFPELNSVAAYRTSESENLAKLSPIGVSEGVFIAYLKSKSVTTYIDRGTGAGLPAVANFVDSGAEPKPKEHGIIKADTKIESESFDDQAGIQTEPCSEGGANVGYIENGDSILYKKIDFAKGFPYFEARVASATSGGNMELRLDSATGTLIGTLTVPSTGGWQNWESKTCAVKGATGIHDLYLVFTGGAGYLFNINWFQFREKGEVSKVDAPKPAPVSVAVGDNL